MIDCFKIVVESKWNPLCQQKPCSREQGTSWVLRGIIYLLVKLLGRTKPTLEKGGRRCKGVLKWGWSMFQEVKRVGRGVNACWAIRKSWCGWGGVSKAWCGCSTATLQWAARKQQDHLIQTWAIVIGMEVDPETTFEGRNPLRGAWRECIGVEHFPSSCEHGGVY